MLQHVVRSTVIDAPIERVWAVLRDFNSHDRWHDVVAESRIEGDERSDQVGCVRSFTLKDGNRIREQLLTLSDREYKSTYCIVEATVPLQRYVATVTLKPVTDGNRTFWHWESTFATPPGQERELRDMVAQGVYEAGFENLRRYLRDGGDLRGAGAQRRCRPPCRCPRAARSCAATAGRTCCSRTTARRAAPARRRGAHPPARDRRQLHRRLPAARLDPGDAAAARRAGHGGGGHGARRRRRASAACCPATASPTSARCPAPTAACAPCRPTGWCACPPRWKTTSPRRRCSRASPPTTCCATSAASAPGTRLLVHAAAGGVGLLVCAWARRLGATVIGTVSSEAKARVAREHGCEHRDRHAATTASPTRCSALRRRRRGDRRHGRRGRARRTSPRSPAAATGSASARPAARCSRSRPTRWWRSRSPSRARWCSTTPRARPTWRARAGRLWQALADGTLKLPPIERHALGAAARRTRGSNRGARSARWC